MVWVVRDGHERRPVAPLRVVTVGVLGLRAVLDHNEAEVDVHDLASGDIFVGIHEILLMTRHIANLVIC